MVENCTQEVPLEVIVNEWAQKNVRALVLFENEDLIFYKRPDYPETYGVVHKRDTVKVILATINLED